MPNEPRPKKLGKIRKGLKMPNFGASKLKVKGGSGPLDLLVCKQVQDSLKKQILRQVVQALSPLTSH